MIDILRIISEDAWVDPLPQDQEAALIESAKAGDESSTIKLIKQYLPLIKKHVGSPGGQDREDAASGALLAVIETIQTHDSAKSPRLAGRLVPALAGAVSQSKREAQTGFSIPAATLKRYNSILKSAGGERDKALALCKVHKMKESTFMNIWHILNSSEIIEEVTHFHGGNDYTIEDALLCEVAFSAVTVEEESVIKHAYGFIETHVDNNVVVPEGHSPLAMNIVSASLGISTPKAKTLKARALSKMRDALNDTEQEAAA